MIGYQIIDCLVMRPKKSQKKASLHELTNNLGMREEKVRSGTRSRLGHALENLKWVSSGYALVKLLLRMSGGEGWIERGHYKTGEHLAAGISIAGAYGFSVSDWDSSPWNMLRMVPKLDASNDFDAWIPWFGREMDRFFDRRIPAREHGKDWYHHVDVGSLDVDFMALMNRIASVWPRLRDWAVATNKNVYDYSLTDAMVASRRWHDKFSLQPSVGCSVPPGRPIAAWQDGARIDRLVTKRDVEFEGASMGHCVAGYWPSVRDGKSVILSYRNPLGVPLVTCDLRKGADGTIMVPQIQGPFDSFVQDRLAAARLAWWLTEILGASPSVNSQIADRLLYRSGSVEMTDRIESQSTDLKTNVDKMVPQIEWMLGDNDSLREERAEEEYAHRFEEIDEKIEQNAEGAQDELDNVSDMFSELLDELGGLLDSFDVDTRQSMHSELYITVPRWRGGIEISYTENIENRQEPIAWIVRVTKDGKTKRRWPHDADLIFFLEEIKLFSALEQDQDDDIPEGDQLIAVLPTFAADWAPGSELVSLFLHARDLPEAIEIPPLGAPDLHLYTEIGENELRNLQLFTRAAPAAGAGAKIGDEVWPAYSTRKDPYGIFLGVTPASGVVHVVWPRAGEPESSLRKRAEREMGRVIKLDYPDLRGPARSPPSAHRLPPLRRTTWRETTEKSERSSRPMSS